MELEVESPGGPVLIERKNSVLEASASKWGDCFVGVYVCMKRPMECLFRWTIPGPRYFNWKYCYVLTFALSVLWLALLTYLVVDLAEKAGKCMGISEDLIGLSVLAIGSSLPDCISSVLIARECKGDMAVCNALGSNVFDILLCLGFTFFLQSVVNGGKSIPVESDAGFMSLILLLFIIQGIFNGILYKSDLVLRKWHGYALIGTYFFFVAYFFIDYEVLVPAEKK